MAAGLTNDRKVMKMSTLAEALSKITDPSRVLTGRAIRPYLADSTEQRGLIGVADVVVLPNDVSEVKEVVIWASQKRVSLTPRGGGTGYSGGAVPVGGVVVSLERLDRVRSFDPLLWRIEVEAGVTTARVQRLARENGLYYPPDPGAAEQSHIGGNIATNAGGPHSFKYGVTRQWVTGLEVVVPPGEILRLGGSVRKDVAGYDLCSLFVGSEGTLGIITSAWLRLLPAPEMTYPVAATYRNARDGFAALQSAMVAGDVPGVLDYLDAATLRIAAPSFPEPGTVPSGFMVLAEVDGAAETAGRARTQLMDAMGEGATFIHAPVSGRDVSAFWRWRSGVPIAVDGYLGGKVSEDIAVPLDRLVEAIDGTLEIGQRHGLEACSWGHAGDGNLHSSFLFSRDDAVAAAAAQASVIDLFDLAVELGGTISGEHGLGSVKSGHLRRMWSSAAVRRHEDIKRLFDPEAILNPGTKRA